MLEKEIMGNVKETLESHKFSGSVIHYHRINSGLIKNSYTGSWVRMDKKGTPDWLVIVRNKENNISIIYIECKSEHGKQTKEQIEFQNKYSKQKDIYYLVIRDINELKAVINKVSYDRLQELTDLL